MLHAMLFASTEKLLTSKGASTWFDTSTIFWGHAQCFKKNADGPISMASFFKTQ